jgi:poly(hydroxyalkanoate) depolymerase family esterase
MTHRRLTAILAVACALLAAATGLQPPAAGAQMPGRTISASYTDTAGTLSYETYVPSTYSTGTPLPLVIALHGCTETADEFRQLTRLDQLAEAQGFIAVFPQQSSDANSLRCWNWFQPANTQRGAGEPSLIAGITLAVMQSYAVDPDCVYAVGLSAGGAMASVMGATYPDLYAAIGIGSGCEYAAGASCAGDQGADPEQAGRQAYLAMGAGARVLPVIVFQGDQDTTVPPVNAQQLVQQWLVTDDWADDGARNGSIPMSPAQTTEGQVPGGRAYTIASYVDGQGREIVQFWLVHGMGHVWSGGCGCEAYADPSGPDESGAVYAFFAAHPAPASSSDHVVT